MDNYEYTAEMQKLLMLGEAFVKCFDDEKLDTILGTLARADSYGMIVDPTTYREALEDGRLDKQRAAVNAVIQFREVWRKSGLPLGEDD